MMTDSTSRARSMKGRSVLSLVFAAGSAVALVPFAAVIAGQQTPMPPVFTAAQAAAGRTGLHGELRELSHAGSCRLERGRSARRSQLHDDLARSQHAPAVRVHPGHHAARSGEPARRAVPSDHGLSAATERSERWKPAVRAVGCADQCRGHRSEAGGAARSRYRPGGARRSTRCRPRRGRWARRRWRRSASSCGSPRRGRRARWSGSGRWPGRRGRSRSG